MNKIITLGATSSIIVAATTITYTVKTNNKEKVIKKIQDPLIIKGKSL